MTPREPKANRCQLGGYAGFGSAAPSPRAMLGYGGDDHEIERQGVVDAMEADADGSHWIAGAKAGYLMPLGSSASARSRRSITPRPRSTATPRTAMRH